MGECLRWTLNSGDKVFLDMLFCPLLCYYKRSEAQGNAADVAYHSNREANEKVLEMSKWITA